MIPLIFVGDGERDAATVPRLAERILGAQVRETCHHWARLHRMGAQRGYGRKLAFAVRVAKDEGSQGVVATLDADKSAGRLKELRAARDTQEAASGLPIAVGEAEPHGEAWLLDDPHAVRTALGLDPSAEVPSVLKVRSPKETLHRLLEQSGTKSRPLDAWADIARRIEPGRCMNSSQTGFRGLVEEVRERLGPIASPAR